MAKNDVLKTESSALTLSQQYPENQYNVLVPIKTVTDIAQIHKPVMNVVSISADTNDEEIYLQNKKTGKYALTKKGLTKLMRAAGIKIKSSETVLPTTCEKCAAVNRAIGKPVNCAACGNKDVKHRVVITMPQLTGENIDIVATREIIVEDEIKGMSAAQKDEFMKFRTEMCESKALTRALRTAMQIKSTYTIDEFKKPFVVAYLAPNLDNPVVRDAAVKSFFNAAQELYKEVPEAPKVSQLISADTDIDDEDNYSFPDPDTDNIVIAPADPIEEEDDFVYCQMCGEKLSPNVIRYSIENFGKPYCMKCQQNVRLERGGSRS